MVKYSASYYINPHIYTYTYTNEYVPSNILSKNNYNSSNEFKSGYIKHKHKSIA